MTLTEECDATLSGDERSLLGRARHFAETVIAPAAKEWEYARSLPLEALRAACREGFAGVELARESGGLGLSFSAKMRMAEELSKHDLAFTFSLIQHHNAIARIAESGTAAAAKLVTGMLAGDLIGCTAMSESGGGSDFSAIRTIAKKVDGGWVLDGDKAWITNASEANVLLTYAQTDAQSGSKGIACFIVTSDAAGFSRQPAYELHGAHAIGVGGYTMKDCFVPDEMLLYPGGAGFKAAMQGVNRARIHVTAMNAGILDASLSIALQYAAQRQAFGKPLLDFQGLGWSLADVATELEAMRLLAYRGARLIDQNEDAQEAAAMAKKFGNDRAVKGIEACMQVMGANGLRADYPLARHLTAAKLLAYTDGTVEMMNERIVHLLRKRIRPESNRPGSQ
jgi:alkylation response protein AidB-like acyl-CoA dehydrogenase